MGKRSYGENQEGMAVKEVIMQVPDEVAMEHPENIVVRCKNCKKGCPVIDEVREIGWVRGPSGEHDPDWHCGDGEEKD